MLFSLDPPGRCMTPSGFLLAPLSARKQLWEAPDADVWMLERCRDIGGVQSVFGILNSGQMIKLPDFKSLQNGQSFVVRPEEVAQSGRNWQEWCSGMDGLGTLSMKPRCANCVWDIH
jgi:hypothetical protein